MEYFIPDNIVKYTYFKKINVSIIFTMWANWAEFNLETKLATNRVYLIKFANANYFSGKFCSNC